MIVDGVEVLYTMRNGKIVDPNIPTEGLVCYLGTRGKYNTDVYRNTLLDLSGNGNHGTLQNFNFTDGSGYENGGLKFDGVDDTMAYTHDIADGQPRTIYIDYEISQLSSTQGISISLPFGIFIHGDNDFVYFGNSYYYSYFYESNFPAGRHKIIITGNGIVDSFQLYKLQTSYSCNPQLGTGKNYIDEKIMSKDGKKIIHKSMLYNRVLTDEEIQQLMEA